MGFPSAVFGFALLFAVAFATAATSSEKPTSKFAFATIIYGDSTCPAACNVLATRVLLKSIRLTGTPHPSVVLVPLGFPPSLKLLLEYEGNIVKIVPGLNVPSPSMSLEDAYVVHVRNKLLLWDQTEFDRLVFLEFDDLVLHPLDRLFECDNFCAIDKAPLLYTSSLWVVTPSDKLTRELVEYAVSPVALSPPYLGITKGFLPVLFEGMEKAPLFAPEAVDKPKGDKAFNGALLHRLPFFYNVNHLFYYEKMNWNLWRCGSSGNLTIPALTLSYRMVPQIVTLDMFPWLWWSPILFDNHASWTDVRETLPSAHDAVKAAVQAGLQDGTLDKAAAKLITDDLQKSVGRRDSTSPDAYLFLFIVAIYAMVERYLISSRGSEKVFAFTRSVSTLISMNESIVWVSSALAWWLVAWVSFATVPDYTLDHKGAVLFLGNHFLGLWMFTRALALIRGDSTLPGIKTMVPVLSITAIVLSFTLFGIAFNGIMKAAFALLGLAATVLLELKLFRLVIRRVVPTAPAKH